MVPHLVFCTNCKKSTNRYSSIGGYYKNIVKFWNSIAPLKEISDNRSLEVMLPNHEDNTLRYMKNLGLTLNESIVKYLIKNNITEGIHIKSIHSEHGCYHIQVSYEIVEDVNFV